MVKSKRKRHTQMAEERVAITNDQTAKMKTTGLNDFRGKGMTTELKETLLREAFQQNPH